VERARDISNEPRRLDDLAPRIEKPAFLAGVAGLVIGVLFGIATGWDVFFRSYVLNYSFVLSLALGGLFFVMLQHLVRAGWSVGVRRLAEFTAGTMPLMVLLFLPLLIPVLSGMPGVYLWANAEAVAGDELLQHKQSYLNVPFFFARCVVYFLICVMLTRYFV
jgi:hypothetical protein